MKPGPSLEPLRISAVALLLAAALLAPFWNKAYTIDDPTFLAGATHILRDPLHPTAFEMVWTSPYRLRASVAFPNSPVMYFLLAPVVAAGGAEWIAHLIQFLLLAGGIVATVSLALRLGLTRQQARWSALLLAATPAVVAMASTAMPDVPAMTFGVLSMDRLLAWRDSHRLRDAVLTFLFLSIAMLTRPHLILLAGVGAILFFLDRKVLAAWPLLLAPLVASAVLRLTRDPVPPPSVGLFHGPLANLSIHSIAPNLIAFLVDFVFVIPLALPWLIRRRRRMPWAFALLLIPAAAALYLTLHPAPKWTAPFALLSALVLADILWDAWTRRDWHQLFLGAWLLLPCLALPYPYMAAKFLVAVAPAVAILVAAGSGTRILAATVAAGAMLSVLIIQADAHLSGLWRNAAASLIAPRVRAGDRVWFAGSWGFYWYAERAGAQPLSWTPPLPKPGDIVVVSSGALRNEIDVVGRHTVLQTTEDSTPGGRIFDGSPAAGFYVNHSGYLPWTWGRGIINRVEVWRVD